MECTLKKFTFLPEIPPLEEFHVALRFTQLGFSPFIRGGGDYFQFGSVFIKNK
jgi:hypothetical protein